MDITHDEAATVKQYVKDLAHPDNGIDGVLQVIDFWNENPGLYDAVHMPDPVTGATIANPGPDPTRAIEKYLRKTSQAAPDWVAGMQNPRADPKAAALAAAGKWADGVARAAQNDAFRRGVQKIDSAEALATAIADNGNAYTAGVRKREQKIRRVFPAVMQALGAVSQQIRQMPQDTPQDREARMLANLNAIRALKGRL